MEKDNGKTKDLPTVVGRPRNIIAFSKLLTKSDDMDFEASR